MPTDILHTPGTQILFGDHAGDYDGGSGNNKIEVGTPVDVQITCASLAAGLARQSDKFDFGENRARAYAVMMSLEMEEDPDVGGKVDLYLSPSLSATPAVANGGGCSGADAAYAGYAASTLAEALLGLVFVGSMNLAVMNDTDGVPQLEFLRNFSPPQRYGSLVVFNDSSVALHSSDDEFGVSFQPIIERLVTS